MNPHDPDPKSGALSVELQGHDNLVAAVRVERTSLALQASAKPPQLNSHDWLEGEAKSGYSLATLTGYIASIPPFLSPESALNIWSGRRELHPQPSDWKSETLLIELRPQIGGSGEDRTRCLLLARQALYQSELHPHDKSRW